MNDQTKFVGNFNVIALTSFSLVAHFGMADGFLFQLRYLSVFSEFEGENRTDTNWVYMYIK